MPSGAVSHICIYHANQEVSGLRRCERKARARLESNSASGLLCSALSRSRPLRVLTQFEPSRFLQYSSPDTHPRSLDLVIGLTLYARDVSGPFCPCITSEGKLSSNCRLGGCRVLWDPV